MSAKKRKEENEEQRTLLEEISVVSLKIRKVIKFSTWRSCGMNVPKGTCDVANVVLFLTKRISFTAFLGNLPKEQS